MENKSTQNILQNAIGNLSNNGVLKAENGRLDDEQLFTLLKQINKNTRVIKVIGNSDIIPAQIQTSINEAKGDEVFFLIGHTGGGAENNAHYFVARYNPITNKIIFHDSAKMSDIKNYIGQDAYFINSSDSQEILTEQGSSLLQNDENACGYLSFLNLLPYIIKDTDFLKKYCTCTYLAHFEDKNNINYKNANYQNELLNAIKLLRFFDLKYGIEKQLEGITGIKQEKLTLRNDDNKKLFDMLTNYLNNKITFDTLKRIWNNFMTLSLKNISAIL